MRQHPSEAFVKVSSRFKRLLTVEDLVLVWIGMVWFGLKKHPSQASVKVSSRSDLFWLLKRRFRFFGLTRAKQFKNNPPQTPKKYHIQSYKSEFIAPDLCVLTNKSNQM